MIHSLEYILTSNENVVTWIDLTVFNQLTTEKAKLLWILFFIAVCLFVWCYAIYAHNFRKFAVVNFENEGRKPNSEHVVAFESQTHPQWTVKKK